MRRLAAAILCKHAVADLGGRLLGPPGPIVRPSVSQSHLGFAAPRLLPARLFIPTLLVSAPGGPLFAPARRNLSSFPGRSLYLNAADRPKIYSFVNNDR
jgi:hypothetical protein